MIYPLGGQVQETTRPPDFVLQGGLYRLNGDRRWRVGTYSESLLGYRDSSDGPLVVY